VNVGASGETPDQIHSFLTTIVFLFFDNVVDRRIEGSIPSELFRLASLSDLALRKYHSLLASTLLQKQKLSHPSIILGRVTANTSLSGTLPSEVGNCTTLRFLDFSTYYTSPSVLVSFV
jgi:hypothetical protein